jgi:hypothetical protein
VAEDLLNVEEVEAVSTIGGLLVVQDASSRAAQIMWSDVTQSGG